MAYKDTLNLPKTDFPMRGNLPKREPQMLKQWQQQGLDAQVNELNRGQQAFVLHDGPPYANGHIHMGHALNKILKDLVLKTRRMEGYYTPYVPGWDCHGLPIELMVDKKLGKKKRDMTKAQIRQECRRYAEKWVDVQAQEFQRLGIFGNWEDPYLTMAHGYEATIARELARFARSGHLYKGKKPVHWCASCVTALAEAEVEYDEHTSPSIYVRFPFVDEPPAAWQAFADKPISLVIWTTTPWTIPANMAVCLHPELSYVAVATQGEVLVLAEGLAATVLTHLGREDYQVLCRFSGRELEGKRCRHPLYERDSSIVLGEHVTLEAGTGCVHTAPGHGQDDYQVGLQYNLPIYNPVDDYGRFRADLEFFGGEKVLAVNSQVTAKLEEQGALLLQEQVSHSYPHCWRCKKPIIFRATEQWFLAMEADQLRGKALDAIDKVTWIPKWGRERIYNMIANRPDWCISRQRSWGVPITVFYCEQCGEALADAEVMEHVADLFAEQGCDLWFEQPAADLLPAGTQCTACGGQSFRKEQDILDVWFDSGVSHAAVLEAREELQSPAQMYLEGSDQHRGWFHSSLLASVGTRGQAPFESVLTHGFVVDGNGLKMSKSQGNVIAPDEVMKQYGAEVLRLWVAAQDYRDDVRISPEILQRLADAYRRIRNTGRYLLGNLYDFQPDLHAVPHEQLQELDRWALSRLDALVTRVRQAYDDYAFHVFYHALYNFCVLDMSSFYLDVLKDRIYCAAPESTLRRSAQTAIYRILDTLTRLIAPVLSFTADELWQHLPGQREASVHLARLPQAAGTYRDTALEETYSTLLQVRSEVARVLEQARNDKVIGQSLEAQVRLAVAGDCPVAKLLNSYGQQLPELFIVSQVVLVEELPQGTPAEELAGLHIEVQPAAGDKCPRCWNYSTELGQDAAYSEVCPRCAAALREMGA